MTTIPAAAPALSGVPQEGSAKAEKVVEAALSKVGSSYVHAAAGPNAFDCSGLTTYAYKQVGVMLPRTSRSQVSAGTRVSASNLQPGDLVFYYSPISHVGIYIGDGKIVDAANPRSGVRVTIEPAKGGGQQVLEAEKMLQAMGFGQNGLASPCVGNRRKRCQP